MIYRTGIKKEEKKHPLSLFLVINKMIMPLTIKQGLLTKEVRKTLSSAIIVWHLENLWFFALPFDVEV